MGERGESSRFDTPVAADFLVIGRVVTMNPGREIVPDGAIAVVDGHIAAVGTRDELVRQFEAKRTLGDPKAIVLPGLIDAHTHCTQCWVRALSMADLPMIPRIYVPAQRSLTPEQAQASVRLISAQLLRSGVTTLCEGSLIPEHDEAVIAAVEETGIRCCLARGAGDQDFHHAALYEQAGSRSWVKAREGQAERDLARTEAMLARYPMWGDGLIRGAVTASSLTGFSETYIREAAALARRHGTTLQVHVGRDREEVEFALSIWGRRPIERLADLGVIDEHLVAVHAVLAVGREIALLGEAGAALAHSPVECVSNLNALPDIQRFRLQGVDVALGCDNQGNDMFVTMRALWMLHTAAWGIASYDPEYVLADEILDMATRESAKVLRWDDRIGSLESGKAADLVVLDGTAPHLMSVQDLTTEIVRFASRAEVRHTMVGGRLLYDDGVFPTIDLEQLDCESEAGAAHVRKNIAGRRYKPLRRRDM